MRTIIDGHLIDFSTFPNFPFWEINSYRGCHEKWDGEFDRTLSGLLIKICDVFTNNHSVAHFWYDICLYLKPDAGFTSRFMCINAPESVPDTAPGSSQ